jgi:hypothetical protein
MGLRRSEMGSEECFALMQLVLLEVLGIASDEST